MNVNVHLLSYLTSYLTSTLLSYLTQLLSYITQLLINVQLLSRVWLLATPWTATHQAPLSMGFSRQEDWSGLPLPSVGDLPISGSNPGLLHARRFFTFWDIREDFSTINASDSMGICSAN